MTWDDSKRYDGCAWLIAKCDVCREKTNLAVGVKSQLQLLRMKILIARGWKVAPKMICPRCVFLTKLEQEEKLREMEFQCPSCGKSRHRILEAKFCENPDCADSEINHKELSPP